MTARLIRDVEPLELSAPQGEAAFDAIESDLLRCAMTLVKDPLEAHALVTLTLAANDTGGQGVEAPSRVRLFRLLRENYHSVDRARGPRSPRGALAVSLALANETNADADAEAT